MALTMIWEKGYELFANSAYCFVTNVSTPCVLLGCDALILDSIFHWILCSGSAQLAKIKSSSRVDIFVPGYVSWSAKVYVSRATNRSGDRKTHRSRLCASNRNPASWSAPGLGWQETSRHMENRDPLQTRTFVSRMSWRKQECVQLVRYPDISRPGCSGRAKRPQRHPAKRLLWIISILHEGVTLYLGYAIIQFQWRSTVDESPAISGC